MSRTDAFQSFEKRVTQTLPQDPVIVATVATSEPVRNTTVAPRETRKQAVTVITPQTDTRKKDTVPAAPVEKTARATPPAKKVPVVTAKKPPVVEPGTSSTQKYPAIETQAAAAAVITPVQAAPIAAPSTTSRVKPDKTETKRIPAAKQEPAARPATPPVATPVATPTRTEKPASTHTGPWVINLLSSPDKAYVDSAMANMRSKGFDVVVTSATVKGKQYWRLQAPGFGSMAAAKTAAEPMKEKLKIKDVWILKR